MDLVIYLVKRGILSSGSFKQTRFTNSRLPLEKHLKQKQSEFPDEDMDTKDGVAVYALIWKNNKFVKFFSTYTE